MWLKWWSLLALQAGHLLRQPEESTCNRFYALRLNLDEWRGKKNNHRYIFSVGNFDEILIVRLASMGYIQFWNYAHLFLIWRYLISCLYFPLHAAMTHIRILHLGKQNIAIVFLTFFFFYKLKTDGIINSIFTWSWFMSHVNNASLKRLELGWWLLHLLENPMQVSRQSRVCELGCSIVVVHKVDAAGSSVSNLPAWRQRTELLAVHITQVPG